MTTMATTFRGNQLPAAARHILLERARELIAAGSPKKPAFWGALQVVEDKVVDVVDNTTPVVVSEYKGIPYEAIVKELVLL